MEFFSLFILSLFFLMVFVFAFWPLVRVPVNLFDMNIADKIINEPLGGAHNDEHMVYNSVKDAKTFCYYEDIEAMKKNGLAKGGSLENAIVIKDGKIMNSNFNHQSNYFAKHKTLDIIGDLSLMDLNIIGNISVYFPGHELNRLGMQEIFSNYSNFRIYQHNKSKDFTSQENILTA